MAFLSPRALSSNISFYVSNSSSPASSLSSLRRPNPYYIHKPTAAVTGHPWTGKPLPPLPTDPDPNYEVDWEGPDDPDNPRNWSAWRKASLVGALTMGTLVVVFYSSSYTSGIPHMMVEFSISSETVAFLGVTTYLLGIAAGSPFVAPLSEMYGRRPVLLGGMALFLLLAIPAAVAPNFASVLVVRFLGAACGSVMLTNSPGSLGDVATEESRALLLAVWTIGQACGPVFGPFVGGFMTEAHGWRSTNYLVLGLSALALALLLLSRETYAPILLLRKLRARRVATQESRWHCRYENRLPFPQLLRVNLARPFLMAFTEPICIFWNLYIAINYAILYLSFVAFPYVFVTVRGWSLGLAGLPWLAVGLGCVLSVLLEPALRRVVRAQPPDPATGKPRLEAVVILVCGAAVLCPVAQFWFAWTSAPPSIPWIAPALAGLFLGGGITVIFVYAVHYLVAAYGRYAASAQVGITVARSVVGATLPLAGPKMYENLGPQWAGSVLGFLFVAVAPIPFVFWWKGGVIRERSRLIGEMRAEMERDVGGKAVTADVETARGKGTMPLGESRQRHRGM